MAAHRMRDPLPYFSAVQRAHPAVDFLLCTDRVGNHYENAPLSVQPEAGEAREGRALGVAVPGEAGEAAEAGDPGATEVPCPRSARLPPVG